MGPNTPHTPDLINALRGFDPVQLGSKKTLKPAVALPIPGQIPLLYASEEKAVDVTFDDGIARMITCTLVNNSVKSGATPPTVINTGPIVGIVEWGVGGGFSRIEFNLPLAYTWAQNGDIVPGQGQIQGSNGVILTVPASSIRVMARNESRLPPIYGNQSATIGPSSTTLNGEFEGFIAQGTGDKQCGSLERCLIVVSANGDALPPNGAANFGIPRFAKAVRFFREPISSLLDVVLAGSLVGSQMGIFQIQPGNVGFLEIPPLHDVIQITNRSAANINSLYAAFILSL